MGVLDRLLIEIGIDATPLRVGLKRIDTRLTQLGTNVKAVGNHIDKQAVATGAKVSAVVNTVTGNVQKQATAAVTQVGAATKAIETQTAAAAAKVNAATTAATAGVAAQAAGATAAVKVSAAEAARDVSVHSKAAAVDVAAATTSIQGKALQTSGILARAAQRLAVVVMSTADETAIGAITAVNTATTKIKREFKEVEMAAGTNAASTLGKVAIVTRAITAEVSKAVRKAKAAVMSTNFGQQAAVEAGQVLGAIQTVKKGFTGLVSKARNGAKLAKAGIRVELMAIVADARAAGVASAKALGNEFKDGGPTSIVGRSLLALGGNFDRFAAKVTTVFKTMGLGIGLAVGAMAVSSGFVGAKFEQKMAEAGAVAGVTGAELQVLTEIVREYGATTQFTATEASQGLINLARDGVKGAEDLNTALGPALLLAGANNLELNDSTKILTSTLAQFSLPVSEAARVADTLSAAAANSKFTVDELATTLSYAAPTAEAFGLSLEETAAVAAMFKKTGVDASTAGTQFRQVLSSLAKLSGPAREKLKKYGLTAADVSLDNVGFTQSMRALGEAGLSTGDAITILGIRGGAAGLKIAEGIAAGGGEIAELTAILESANGVAGQMNAKILDTVIGQFDLMKSAFAELQLSLFDTFGAGVADVFGALQVVFTQFSADVRAASGEIENGFAAQLGFIAKWLRRNAKRLSSMFLTTLDAAGKLGGVLIRLIPLLDEIFFLVAGIFAAVKLVQMVQGVMALVKGVAALHAGVVALGASATVATGGAIVAIGAIALAIGYLVTNLVSARNEVERISRAQEAIAKFEADKEEDRAFQSQIELKLEATSTIEHLTALQDALALNGERLSDLQLAELNLLATSTDRELADMAREGSLMSLNGQLRTRAELEESNAFVPAANRRLSGINAEIDGYTEAIAKLEEMHGIAQAGGIAEVIAGDEAGTDFGGEIKGIEGIEAAMDSAKRGLAERQEAYDKLSGELVVHDVKQKNSQVITKGTIQTDREKADALALRKKQLEALNAAMQAFMDLVEKVRRETVGAIAGPEFGIRLAETDALENAKKIAAAAVTELNAEISRLELGGQKARAEALRAQLPVVMSDLYIMEASIRSEARRQLRILDRAEDEKDAKGRDKHHATLRNLHNKGEAGIAALRDGQYASNAEFQARVAEETEASEERSRAAVLDIHKKYWADRKKLDQKQQDAAEVFITTGDIAAEEAMKDAIAEKKALEEQYSEDRNEINRQGETEVQAILAEGQKKVMAGLAQLIADMLKMGEGGAAKLMAIFDLFGHISQMFGMVSDAIKGVQDLNGGPPPIGGDAYTASGAERQGTQFGENAGTDVKLGSKVAGGAVAGAGAGAAAGFGATVAMAAAFGTAGGPLGTVIGAAVGVITGTVVALTKLKKAANDAADATLKAGLDMVGFSFDISGVMDEARDLIAADGEALREELTEEGRLSETQIDDQVAKFVENQENGQGLAVKAAEAMKTRIDDAIAEGKALITALPSIMKSFLAGLPALMTVLNRLKPFLTIVAKIWKDVFDENRKKNADFGPKSGFTDDMMKAYNDALKDGDYEKAAKIAARATKIAEEQFGQVGDDSDTKNRITDADRARKAAQVAGSAYSGISYVPANMRMMVHKGEEIIPASERNAEVVPGGPAAPRASRGGAANSGDLNVNVNVNGDVLDRLLVSRNGTPKTERKRRRVAGKRIGMNVG